MADVVETVTPAAPSSDSSTSVPRSAVFVESVPFSAAASMGMEKATTKALLSKLDEDDEEDDDDDAPLEGDEPAPAEAKPPAEAKADDKPKEEAPDPTAEYKAVNDRLIAKNRDLLARLEGLEKGKGKRDPSPREKALMEAEETYLDKPNEAIRRFLATAIGVDDPKSPEVDKELSGLLQDLTEWELQVSPTEAAKTNREAVRMRHGLARQKREMAEERARMASAFEGDPVAAQASNAARVISEHLATKDSAGKLLADSYPLLTSVAADVDGDGPDVLIFREITRAISAGELAADDPNDKLIAAAAKKLESRYQALADKLGKARQPSTATPSTEQAPVTTSPTEGADRSSRVRKITEASASVAPATSPTKPEAKAEKPKYSSEVDRRRAIISKHFGTA